MCIRVRLYSGRAERLTSGGACVSMRYLSFTKEEQNVKEKLWRCTFARVVAILMVVALVPLPALAGESGQPSKSPKGLAASIATNAAREAAASTRTPAPVARQADQAKNPDLGTWGFFKTPLGIGVVAVLAVGTGYAIYSQKHDRILAPGR